MNRVTLYTLKSKKLLHTKNEKSTDNETIKMLERIFFRGEPNKMVIFLNSTFLLRSL